MAKIKSQKKGNIVRIEGRKGEWLVVEALPEGYFYAVPMAAADVVTGGVDDTKGKVFSHNAPASALPGSICLTPGDVAVIGKAKFKTVTTTLHFVKSTTIDSPK